MEDSKEGLSVSSDKASITISGIDFRVQFDLGKGELISLDFGNENMLLSGIKANFWRPSLDNDFGYNMPKLLEKWRQATDNKQFLGMKIESNGSKTIDGLKLVENPFETKKGKVSISSIYALPSVGGVVGIAYEVNDKGEVRMTSSLTVVVSGTPKLPRFGNNFSIKDEYQRVEWYGRPP